jgi:hypothetical protein
VWPITRVEWIKTDFYVGDGIWGSGQTPPLSNRNRNEKAYAHPRSYPTKLETASCYKEKLFFPPELKGRPTLHVRYIAY